MNIENNNTTEKDSPTVRDYVEIIIIGAVLIKCVFHILIH